MKIINLTDVQGFLALLDECEDVVELVTSEGDRLNLKSKLCQYVALSRIFSEARIEDIEVVAHNPNDAMKIFNFLMKRE